MAKLGCVVISDTASDTRATVSDRPLSGAIIQLIGDAKQVRRGKLSFHRSDVGIEQLRTTADYLRGLDYSVNILTTPRWWDDALSATHYPRLEISWG